MVILAMSRKQKGNEARRPRPANHNKVHDIILCWPSDKSGKKQSHNKPAGDLFALKDVLSSNNPSPLTTYPRQRQGHRHQPIPSAALPNTCWWTNISYGTLHLYIVKVKNNGKKIILQSPEEPWVWPLPRFIAVDSSSRTEKWVPITNYKVNHRERN
eukprot:scaffold45404_cov24-Cyclotella_meneghiniana.AAC.1